MRRERSSIRGFTLTESVVALAILAVTMTVVYQIFGWSLRHTADQRRKDWAWLTAQSLLDQLRTDDALAPGHHTGKTPQGLAWETIVKPFNGAADVPLLEVDVRVTWKEQPSRYVELRSLEFGARR